MAMGVVHPMNAARPVMMADPVASRVGGSGGNDGRSRGSRQHGGGDNFHP
jgi:hypothetical protein